MGIETENKEILSELLDSYENLVLHPETIIQNWDKSLKEIFRWVHTVKGAYGFMDMQAQADFLHEFETGLQKLQSLEANQSNTQIVIQGLDKIHDDLMCLLAGKPGSLLTASASYLMELQKISSLNTLGIEDVIGVLEDTLARLKLVRNYQKSSEEVKVFYDKVLEFSQFFANKEDFRVSVVVNSLLLKNVIHEGVDLTHSVRQVLRGIEHLILGRNEIDVFEANRHLSMFLKTIHYTKGIADFTQLLATREVLPELLEDFYRLFWEELVASTDKVELMDGNELVSLTDESEIPGEEVATTKETPVAQIETVKVDSRYLSQFTQNVESLIMYRNYLDNLESEIRPCLPSAMATDLKYGLHEIGESISSLYQSLLLIRRARASMIMDKLPKQIRQLSIELGKEVGLELIGGEIEVDRNVLFALQEPLIHLLRNSMDHGIENPQTRRNQNKPSQGTIVIQASVDNSSFVLAIEDDGRGIDKDQILKKAIDKGLARQDRDYTDDEIYGFLFASGFSTAETISNVSGRGVGLDSVSHTIKRLGGKIEIQSTKGKGSRFCLTVPQNEGVKTRRLILLVCANQQFAIKESEVLEIVDSAKLGVFKQSDGIAMYRDSVISYLNLANLFQLNSLNLAETFKAMVIVQIKTIRFGLLVDRIVQTLDAVIEPIQNKKLNQNQFFEGTVAIGSKAPILVLNLKNLVAVYSSKAISPEVDRIV